MSAREIDTHGHRCERCGGVLCQSCNCGELPGYDQLCQRCYDLTHEEVYGPYDAEG